MTDRQLLELAAKAAFGHTVNFAGWKWNPLTDDGDALRLAEKLKLEISRAPDGDFWVVRDSERGGKHIRTIARDQDLKRAITKMAAVIGNVQ